MILGTNWMRLVSPVVFNFQEENIIVKCKGRNIELRRNSREENKVNMTNRLSKFSIEDAYFLCQVAAVEEEQGETNKIPPVIEGLVTEPNELPPPRIHDHLIPLKEGSNPVSSNPYRCPFVQKKEIEKIVREMLTSGIVRHSISPFASLVLLVKKKDQSWRLSVDYRALNSMTIENKYPIPIIVEL